LPYWENAFSFPTEAKRALDHPAANRLERRLLDENIGPDGALRGSAMTWIVTADEPNAITITVDGRFVDDCVDAVKTCSNQAAG